MSETNKMTKGTSLNKGCARKMAKKQFDVQKNAVSVALAERISELIDARQWTRGTFALALGQNPCIITRFLSGYHNFTLDTLTEIAIVLGVDIAELFTPVKRYKEGGKLDATATEVLLNTICNKMCYNLNNVRRHHDAMKDFELSLVGTIRQLEAVQKAMTTGHKTEPNKI